MIVCTCTYSKVIIILYRGKKFRIFMSGDYEFLSHMYGITGAQGNKSYSTKHDCSNTLTLQDDIHVSGALSPHNIESAKGKAWFGCTAYARHTPSRSLAFSERGKGGPEAG